MEVQDVHGGEPAELESVATAIMAQANQTPGLAGVFTTFSTKTPQGLRRYRPRARRDAGRQHQRRVPDAEVFLGSQYVNDFNFLGRTYRVTAQADGDFRQDLHAIGNLKTRNAKGDMVPLSLGRLVPQHHRALPRRAFQPVPVGRRARRYAAGVTRPATGSPPWRRSRKANMPDGYSFSGPSSLIRRSWPATPPSSCSAPRWSSCSCCSPRNMKAGRCRSR